MNKLAVIGGSSILLLGVAWAGTTWYGGHQIVQQLPQAVAKLSENAPGAIKFVVKKQDVGFLTTHMDWDLVITPDPCQPEHTITLSGYNVIHNGVLPSLGMGQIETHINFPTKVKDALSKFFGTKEPLQITTNVNLLGGYTTTIVSPTATYKDDKGSFNWLGLKVEMGANRDGSNASLSGAINGATYTTVDNSASAKLDPISFDSKGTKGQAGFNLGLSHLQAAGFSLNTPQGQNYGFKDLKLVADASEKGGFLTIKETLQIAELLQGGKSIGKADLAMTLDHIDSAALKNVLDVQKKMSAECRPSPEPLLQAAKPLFTKGLKLSIDHIDLDLFGGKAHADAVANLPPMTDAEAADIKQAISKFEIDAKANVSQTLINQLATQAMQTQAQGQPVNAEQTAQMIDGLLAKPIAEGLLTKTADGYASVLQIRNGQTVVNGKALTPQAPATATPMGITPPVAPLTQ